MTDIIACLFLLWIAVMVVGLVITLMPLVLVVVGFFLAIGFFTLIGTIAANLFS